MIKINPHYLLSLLLVSPVFIGFRSSEIVFNVNVFNPADFPALPLGLFFLFFFFRIRALNNYVNFFLIAITIIVVGSLIYFFKLFKGTSYLLAIGCCSLAYVVGRDVARNLNVDAVTSNISKALLYVVGSKFIFDLYGGKFISDYFIFENVKIYSFYDYYPLVYLLMAVSSVSSRSLMLSALMFAFSLIVFFSFSRFYMVAVFLFYLLYVVRLYRLSFPLIFSIMLMSCILASYLGSYMASVNIDPSFNERFSHWESFFNSYDLADILFPILNSYRQELNNGSLHNELLDAYSYFGMFFLLVIYLIYKCFSSTDLSLAPAIKVLLVVLMLGTLIQNNFSHLWSGILIFFVLGSYTSKRSINGSRSILAAS